MGGLPRPLVQLTTNQSTVLDSSWLWTACALEAVRSHHGVPTTIVAHENAFMG